MTELRKKTMKLGVVLIIFGILGTLYCIPYLFIKLVIVFADSTLFQPLVGEISFVLSLWLFSGLSPLLLGVREVKRARRVM